MENNIEEKKEKKETVKDWIIILFKESLKLGLLGIMLMLIVGLPLVYILIEFFRLDVDIIGMIGGFAVAILFFIIDIKILHSSDKIYDANFKIMKMIFHRL